MFLRQRKLVVVWDCTAGLVYNSHSHSLVLRPLSLPLSQHKPWLHRYRSSLSLSLSYINLGLRQVGVHWLSSSSSPSCIWLGLGGEMSRDQQLHLAAGSEGWPLGLEPLNLQRLRLVEHLRLSSSHHHNSTISNSFLFSTPSVTSGSSSDLDTESTGSFFPERSTTLGSLIGIHSGSQTEQSRGITQQLLSQTGSPRRRAPSKHNQQRCCFFLICASRASSPSTSTSSSSAAAAAAAVVAAATAAGGGGRRGGGGMTPSLAHLLEMERRSPGRGRGFPDGGSVLGLLGRNTLFDEEGILPPLPSGAPLKLMLQQGSPTSSYIAADWSSAGATLPHAFHGGSGRRADVSSSSGHHRFPALLAPVCGRFNTSAAS